MINWPGEIQVKVIEHNYSVCKTEDSMEEIYVNLLMTPYQDASRILSRVNRRQG